MNIKLSTKDIKIIAELDKNCRQSDAKIGKNVGLSQPVVRYRINRLIKTGAIRQFYTVIDTTNLGYSIHKAYFKLQNMQNQTEEELKRVILNHNNIAWAGICDGAWDLSITILSKNAIELDKILKEFSNQFNKNILFKSVLLVVEIPHFVKYDKKDAQILNFGSDTKTIKLDIIDKKILSILSVNARISYIELAKSANITIDIARYRVKTLKKLGIIKGFRVWINHDIIGKQVYKILVSFQNSNLEREKTLIGFCKRSSS